MEGEERPEGEAEWDSQLSQLLAELPGVGLDPADGVVAEVELLQGQQPVQPALIHLRQVVVVQLPADTDTHTHSDSRPS